MKNISLAIHIFFLATICILSVSAQLMECGHMLVTCPCGAENNQEIEVPIKLCRIFSYEHFPPRAKCSPCAEMNRKHICSHFRHCYDCVSTRRSRCSNVNVDPSKVPRTFCPRPIFFHNGELTVKDMSSPGDVMHYKCHHRYRLEGNGTRTCTSDFRWSGKPSRCVRKISCDTPKMPSHGHIGDDSNKYDFEYLDTVRYECKKEYILIGDRVRRCLRDGTWSGNKPICIPVATCQDPGIPKDTSRIDTRPDNSEPNSPFPVGSILKYNCSEGYKLYGSSVQKCVAGGKWRGKQPACVVECGTVFRPEALPILNGGEFARGFLPWMAAISLHTLDDKDITCGGSLVSERVVVTAAHCVAVADTTETYPLDRISVYLGKIFRNHERDDKIVQTFEVADLYIHEDYNPRMQTNDIALIYLSRDATINTFVRPICLPTNENSLKIHTRSSTLGYVSGWGYTEHKRKAERLQTAKVNVFKDRLCLEALRTKNYKRKESDMATMFCAGTLDVLYGKNVTIVSDASRFDSGGGLAFQTCTTFSPRWYLEGIVSWGLKDGVGVYVRVSTYTDWIISMI